MPDARHLLLQDTALRYFHEVAQCGSLTEASARLHVARTVCRRAERAIISLGSIEPVGDPLLRYMNRLSDLFFAMARRANHERGHADVPWTPKQA